MTKKLLKLTYRIILIGIIFAGLHSNINFTENKIAHAQEQNYSEQSPVQIKAYKVVCDNEQDLPNWGEGGNNRPSAIDGTTASEYVNDSKGNCRLDENWSFQWGFGDDEKNEKEGVNKLPGAHLGKADGTLSDCYFQCGDNTKTGPNYEEWKDFDSATLNSGNTPASVNVNADFEIPGIWVRENLKPNYLAFTYPPAGSFEDNVTAELYCHNDIRNYDNYDFIYNPKPGNTYYCVAFNVLTGEGIDLAINKDDGVTKVQIGDKTTYVLTITNLGDRTATGVTVTDIVPEGIDVVEVSNGGNYDQGQGKITWELGELEAGESVDLMATIKVRGDYEIEEFPEIENVARVKDDGKNGTDLNPENNEDNDIDEITDIDSPILKLTKTNNSGGQKLQTGDTVVFTLRVEAFEDLEDVVVVDLPAEGFDYIGNSWSANSNSNGDLKANNALAEPTYSSPGSWTIGSMEKGEVLQLSYRTAINNNIDEGLYKDMAWARGYYENGIVLANETIAELETFVGTEVEVIEENAAPKADVDIDVEEIIEIQEVLGTTNNRLPNTGIGSIWMILILASFVTGFVLIGYVVVDYIKARHVIAIAFLAILTTFTPKAFAANDFEIRIEEPETSTNQEFEIGFVALDINGNSMTMKCLVKKPDTGTFSQFGNNIDLAAGGDSANCSVTKSVLSADGEYVFKVEGNNGNKTISSTEVKVKYDNEGPQRPKWIEKDQKSECKYEITFKTADDNGNTDYVEVYREDRTEFDAKASTRVKTINIGSNEEYTFIDEVSGDACKETQYYAVRAFDAAGNPSKVRAEGDIEEIQIKTIEVENQNNNTLGAIEVLQIEENLNQRNGTTNGLGDLGLEIDGISNGSILGDKSEEDSDISKVLNRSQNDESSFPWLLLAPIVFVGIYMLLRRNND